MAQDKIIPTERELAGLDLNDPQTHELIQHAQDADAADKKLTVKQALKKYKKAVFWAGLLSVSLIMEGYDLVIVRQLESRCHISIEVYTNGSSLALSMDRPSSANASVHLVEKKANTSSLLLGSLASQTRLKLASWRVS